MQDLNLKLLPRHVKLVGLALLPVTLLAFFVIDKFQLAQFGGEEVFTALKSVALMSVACVIISEDKVENDTTQRLRLQAMAGAFFFGIFFVAIQPFTNLAFEGRFSFDSDMGIFGYLMIMICFYLGTFYYAKWKNGLYSMPRKKEG